MSRVSKDRLTKRISRAGSYTILITVGVAMIVPVILLLTSSVKLREELMAYPFQFFPKTWQWINYKLVFTMTPFLKVAWRTFWLGGLTATLTAISSAMGGYAFARYQDVKANKGLFRIIIVLMLVPGIVVIIPQFILYSVLHLTNTYWPWIFGALGGDAFFIFLYRQFFLGFPKELEEAAEIDGCGPARIFFQILLPNSKPVIATVMIFAFNGVWSDYFTPLIYLNDDKTLLGVKMATAFVDPHGFPLSTVSMAATVIYILPLIIMFFLAQKYIMKGLITSGLKG